MDRKVIGILRGGDHEHYDSSLEKGADIIVHIAENLSDKYLPVDIFIDRDNIWHFRGVPIEPRYLSNIVDVVWNMAHTSYSIVLEELSVPVIETVSFFSSPKKQTNILRDHLKGAGIKMPRSVLIPAYLRDLDGDKKYYALKKAKEVFEKFSAPWQIRSLSRDKNMAVHLAKTFPELASSIEDGLNHNTSLVVEEFVSDQSVQMHSVAGFRGEDIYVFPPEGLPKEIKEKAIELIKNLHKHLRVKHYLKSELAYHPKRGLFLKNVGFAPDLKQGSQFEKICESVGAKVHHIVDDIIKSVLK